jgi:isopentenyldiphosphate isomerase
VVRADTENQSDTGRTSDIDRAEETTPLALAADLLQAVRYSEPTRRYERSLRDLPPAALRDTLATDDRRLAFWLNVYNAHVQLLLDAAPEQYDDRRRFFGAAVVAVAGHELSLDDVEHGLLRRSRHSLGLGYLPRRADAFERVHRLDSRDPRIHFALNCGAESCPPILAYDHGTINEQLDTATAGFLEAEVAYDPARDVARVPRHMLWYHGDFGGRRGIRTLLRDHGTVPADATPAIRYRSYDWSLALGRFADAGTTGSGE